MIFLYIFTITNFITDAKIIIKDEISKLYKLKKVNNPS